MRSIEAQKLAESANYNIQNHGLYQSLDTEKAFRGQQAI